jgi:hypothetical protein
VSIEKSRLLLLMMLLLLLLPQHEVTLHLSKFFSPPFREMTCA